MSKLVKEKGIIVHTTKYGETSVIAHILTAHSGMRAFIIHGVRKNKSNISPTAAQIMSMVDVDYYNSENSDLFRVKEIKVSVIQTNLTKDIRKMSMGLFICELTKKAIHHFDLHDHIYQLLNGTLLHIESAQSPWNSHLWFTVHLLEHLGIGIHFADMSRDGYFDLLIGAVTPHRPGHNLYFDFSDAVWYDQLKNHPLEDFDQKSIDNIVRYRLLEGMIAYLREHGSSFRKFNSLEILRDLFSN